MNNVYAYCAQCGFGIEVNQRARNVREIHAEFIFCQSGLDWCYWCYKKRAPRTTAELKSLLADAEVLHASALRIKDAESIRFYSHQVTKAREVLGLEAPAPEAQGSLF